MAFLQAGTLALIGKLSLLLIASAMGVMLPMVLMPAKVGTFFLAQIAIATGAVAAQAGLTLTVPTLVGQALSVSDTARAGAVCRTALGVCLVGALTVCLAAWGMFQLFPTLMSSFFGTGGWLAVLVFAIIPLAALSAVLTEIHRAARGMAIASLLPAAQGGAIASLLAISLAFSLRPTTEQLLFAGWVGLMAGTVVGLARLQAKLSLWPGPGKTIVRPMELAILAWPGLLTSLTLLTVSVADQAIAGAFGGTVDAAHYGLGFRLANLLTLPLAIVNATIIPHIVERWTIGHRRRLQWLLTMTASGATYCALLGFAALIVIDIVGPAPIWDQSYAPALTVAVILGLAQVIHTAGGSSGYLLLLLGYQKAFMALTLIVGLPTLGIAAWVMVHFGVLGLATTMAAANAIQTVISIVMTKWLLGLDAVARPLNPLRLYRALVRPVFNTGRLRQG